MNAAPMFEEIRCGVFVRTGERDLSDTVSPCEAMKSLHRITEGNFATASWRFFFTDGSSKVYCTKCAASYMNGLIGLDSSRFSCRLEKMERISL